MNKVSNLYWNYELLKYWGHPSQSVLTPMLRSPRLESSYKWKKKQWSFYSDHQHKIYEYGFQLLDKYINRKQSYFVVSILRRCGRSILIISLYKEIRTQTNKWPGQMITYECACIYNLLRWFFPWCWLGLERWCAQSSPMHLM